MVKQNQHRSLGVVSSHFYGQEVDLQLLGMGMPLLEIFTPYHLLIMRSVSWHNFGIQNLPVISATV